LSNASHGKPQAHRIDDTKAVISKSLGHGVIPTPHVSKPQVIDISTDSSSSSGSDEDSDDEEEEANDTLANQPNGESRNHADSPTSSIVGSDKENIDDDEDQNHQNEPSFGDLLATTGSAPIDVQSTLHPSATSASSVLAPHHSSSTQALFLPTPSSATLSTVLAQALRTNDASLLESCLQLNDLAAVRGTITRLPSPLAEALLTALAARLHARPGRANNLMVWLQWTLVAHGGYLAGRRGLVARLGALQRVVRERANGLAPLLALKGKLDMLSAQMELRRLAGTGEEDDSEEGVVVYVEDAEDAKDGLEDIADDDDDNDEDEDEDGLLAAGDDDAILHDLEERDDSNDESSSEDDSDNDSDASSRGFSDQGVEEDVSSSSGDEEDASPAPKAKLRKGR
jgi:U3 small nucleolar RNA-associated protein 5